MLFITLSVDNWAHNKIGWLHLKTVRQFLLLFLDNFPHLHLGRRHRNAHHCGHGKPRWPFCVGFVLDNEFPGFLYPLMCFHLLVPLRSWNEEMTETVRTGVHNSVVLIE